SARVRQRAVPARAIQLVVVPLERDGDGVRAAVVGHGEEVRRARHRADRRPQLLEVDRDAHGSEGSSGQETEKWPNQTGLRVGSTVSTWRSPDFSFVASMPSPSPPTCPADPRKAVAPVFRSTRYRLFSGSEV